MARHCLTNLGQVSTAQVTNFCRIQRPNDPLERAHRVSARWVFWPQNGWFMMENLMKWFTAWWFGTCFIFPYIGNFIIPIDFHIFQRGSNHQPDDFWIAFPGRFYQWKIPKSGRLSAGKISTGLSHFGWRNGGFFSGKFHEKSQSKSLLVTMVKIPRKIPVKTMASFVSSQNYLRKIPEIASNGGFSKHPIINIFKKK